MAPVSDLPPVDDPGGDDALAAGVPPTAETVRQALAGVIDPELGASIVDLGMVRAVEVSAAGLVEVEVALTIAGCPLRDQI
ncbi:MAG TPA: iron-sulfur cluster assembly protein, partial [Acidimicrobiales bacterium]|nr:iron-sulfur cluster assembly protein [Acidimicrobiales bacterium]